MNGIIKNFQGSWSSGLALLVIQDEQGTIRRIPCDNAPTVRALADLFPNVIAPGHCVNAQALKGQSIQFEMDDLGLLEWISD